eukprot:TRINITY_DN25802_c0_g1_i1.p1 TRINITY_DN25802_c0_g1~~TRINITY_DN25802_c0_g1_i1.p1  ORF type:complete len:596 (-),score=80.09 TRINITY_DN25802_c0_g1_i1:308-2095(-)
MEVALVPIACTAVDLALDGAAGMAGPALACGSGRKLKSVLVRSRQTPSLLPPAAPLSTYSVSTTPSSSSKPVFAPAFTSLGAQRRWSSWQTSGSSAVGTDTRPRALDLKAVPNPRQQPDASWISDPGLMLSALERSELNRVLERIKVRTGCECALVMLDDVRDSHEATSTYRLFGTHLFNYWGVGSSDKNNGVLVLLFREAGRLEIVTGAGFSQILPDDWLLDMQQRVMAPVLRAAPAEGLKAGLEAIEERLRFHAPSDWQDMSASSTQCPGSTAFAFGGGRSAPRADDTSHAMAVLLGLAAAACAGLSGFSDSRPRLRDLEEKLAALENRPTYKDAAGTVCSWPYAALPASMDLLDTASADSAPGGPRHLFEALAKDLVRLRSQSHGFGSEALEVHLKNTGSDMVWVTIPAGSLFVQDDGSERGQPLITQEVIEIFLEGSEERTLRLDVFSGDSGASAAGGNMALSPYVVDARHLESQDAVWRWCASHQRVGIHAGAACHDVAVLRESFGMSDPLVEEVVADVCTACAAGQDARAKELQSLRDLVAEERRRCTEATHRHTHVGQRSHGRSAGSASSSHSFGGGVSIGGGAGCSF